MRRGRHTMRRVLVMVCVSCLAALAGCGEREHDSQARTASVARPAPPRAARHPAGPPLAGCRRVAPGEKLQEIVRAAAEGEALCLLPGRHAGPLVVDRRVSIVGPREAVIVSNGVGTTVLVLADGARLAGVTVDGSGARYDQQDAAVAVRNADDVAIEGVRVVHAVFGILADRTNRTVIVGNEVEGDPSTPLGLRGDGIRLWETRAARIEDNVMRHSRDLVVWYSPGNRFAGNHVEHGRYGTHFMYSGDNVVERSVFDSNSVGIFVMYSRGLRLVDNDLLDASGPSGMGIGVKDSGNVEIAGNHIENDATGLYLDASPLTQGERDVITRNTFRACDRAVVFHGPAAGNTFEDNAFSDNREQFVVEGGGDALLAALSRNRFDDYAGYDLDGDGYGDVPYELRSLSNQLVSSRPSLAFFEGTPALGIIETVGRIVPLFRPHTIVVDPRPRMQGGGAPRERGRT